ncbi:hypothetical protein [uncultured Hymenobacter sp.]|uniref:hypothetical protein n=1 Tax=uncultured Hymenobacter sp. TaxID=170016 RepID=UPI0035CABE55
MFPPDDYLEDSPESNSEPEEVELSAAMALIPADFYEQLAPVLQLCAVANFLLLGRQTDPVPQAIAQLTGFDLAATRQVSRLRSSAGLGRLLLQQPERLHDYLLLGQLTFASSLFDAVRRLLPDEAGEDDEVAESLREFLIETSEEIITNLTEFLTFAFPTLDQDWHLRRLQLESIFARLEDTLVPLRLPADAQESTTADTAAVAAQLQLSLTQSAALQAALALPAQLAQVPELPFARAVAELPGLPPAQAAALRKRFQQLSPASTIALSLPELALLYQAAQVRALALVSGALDDLPAPCAARSSSATPFEDCAELEQFVQFIQTTFPDELTLMAARREVETLTILL